MLSIDINGWNVGIKFSSSHLIPLHEKCGRIHGHTYAIHARFHGKPNDEGILYDFNLVKKILKSIADELDHKMLIPTKNKFIILNLKDEVEMKIDKKRYIIPKEDSVLLPIKSTTAEELAYWVLTQFLERCKLPNNINEIEIGVDESIGQGSWVKKKIR